MSEMRSSCHLERRETSGRNVNMENLRKLREAELERVSRQTE